jgi:hypothetical protein
VVKEKIRSATILHSACPEGLTIKINYISTHADIIRILTGGALLEKKGRSPTVYAVYTVREKRRAGQDIDS